MTPPANSLTQADRMLCRCLKVTESQVEQAITLDGAASVRCVTKQTGAGGGCNACHCAIKSLLARRHASHVSH